MSDTPEVLDAEAAARRVGIQPVTFRTYHAQGRAPRPDGHVAGRPWWWSSTVDQWQASRPGRGRWGKR